MIENIANSPPCEAAEKAPVYIEGYLTQRINAGETPDYGYPKNHVPAAVIAEMELVTGYAATRQKL